MKAMDFYFCTQDTQLYEGIGDGELSQVETDMTKTVFEAGDILFSPQKPAQQVYILKEGEVELCLEEDGKKIILDTIFPGEVFGHFSPMPTQYTARLVHRSLLCTTAWSEFEKVIKDNSDLCFRFSRMLADRMIRYENRLASKVRSAKEQIMDELAWLDSRSNRSFMGKIFRIPVRISHQRLSERVGLNRVTVTKLLGELKKDGRVEIDQKTGEVKIKV